MIIRSALSVIGGAVVLVTLTACSAVAADFWLVTSSGRVSFGTCSELTIDALTVSTKVNRGEDFTGSSQEIEASGPVANFAEGEAVDCDRI